MLFCSTRTQRIYLYVILQCALSNVAFVWKLYHTVHIYALVGLLSEHTTCVPSNAASWKIFSCKFDIPLHGGFDSGTTCRFDPNNLLHKVCRQWALAFRSWSWAPPSRPLPQLLPLQWPLLQLDNLVGDLLDSPEFDIVGDLLDSPELDLVGAAAALGISIRQGSPMALGSDLDCGSWLPSGPEMAPPMPSVPSSPRSTVSAFRALSGALAGRPCGLLVVVRVVVVRVHSREFLNWMEGKLPEQAIYTLENQF